MRFRVYLLIPLLFFACKGSETLTDSATCPSSAALETKNTDWNQSVILNGEITTTTSREVTLVLSARNNNGVSAYFLSEEATIPEANNSGWVAATKTMELSTNASFTLSEGSGNKTVYSWFKDSEESVSPVSCLTVVLDASGPTGSLSLNSGNATTSSLEVTASITASSTTNITAYALSEDPSTASGQAPEADSSLWNTLETPTTSASLEVPFALAATTGEHTVYAWIKNDAGQVSSRFDDTITMEVTSLTASLSINSGANSTTDRSVTLTLSGLGPNNITGYIISESVVTAPAVGDSSWTAITPSISLSQSQAFTLSEGDGEKNLYLHLKDSVGTNETASVEITLDATPPTGSLLLDSGAKLTVDSEVSGTITGVDSLGVVGYYLSSSNAVPEKEASGWISVTSTPNLSKSQAITLTAPLSGLKTHYLWLKDSAGNISETISDGIEVLRISIANANSQNVIGLHTSITINSSDEPAITVYRQNGGGGLHIYVGSLTNSGLLDGAGDVGDGTSIAFDSDDKIHVAYRDTTNGTLKYTTNASGSWEEETVEVGGISPSIAVDSNGVVHMSHQASNKVRYVSGSAGSWSSVIANSNGTFAVTSALTLGPADRVDIVSSWLSPTSVKYLADAGGNPVEETVDTRHPAGAGGSIVTAPDGTVFLSYPQGGNSVQVAVRTESGWTLNQIDTVVGAPTSASVDTEGFIHIVYYNTDSDDLKYATNLTGSWSTMTLDSTGDVGNYCDIAIDSNDRLHISYYDATNGKLKYATTAD